MPWQPNISKHCPGEETPPPRACPPGGAHQGWSCPGMAMGEIGWTQPRAWAGRARRLPGGASHPSPLLSRLSAEPTGPLSPMAELLGLSEDPAEQSYTRPRVIPSVQTCHDPLDPRELAGASGLPAKTALRAKSDAIPDLSRAASRDAASPVVTSPSASFPASSWASIPQSALFCVDTLAIAARKRSKCKSLGRSPRLGQTATKALLRPRLRLD